MKKIENPERVALWTAALRSGEFEQTTKGCLHDNTGLCCLGVLCEVAMRNGVPLTKQEVVLPDPTPGSGPDATVVHTFYNDEENFLPSEVVEWIGLSNATSDVQETLASMNDTGDSFRRIANWIEQNVEPEWEDGYRNERNPVHV